MRAAQVYYNGLLAGVLSKAEGLYWFAYDRNYLVMAGSRPVSLTLPLREPPYESDVLFPPFVNMLSEGSNKALQNRMLKVDEEDYFELLLALNGDRVGPLTIKEEDDEPA